MTAPLGGRPKGLSLTVASTVAGLVVADRKWIVLDGLSPQSGLMSLSGPPFSTRSSFAGRTMASGFRRRYVPNALSTGWHTKNRAVIEARPDRDSFPLLQQRIGFNRKIIMRLALLRANGTLRRWTTSDAAGQRAYVRPPWWLFWLRCARRALVPSFATRRAAPTD